MLIVFPSREPALPDPASGFPAGPELGIAAKVAFLRRPEAYAGRPAAVEAIETHISWVFLAGDQVYKLKKPVRHGYLDFSTLAARRRDCEREIRLNRRLAPGIYLGKVPLAQAAGGGFALGGSGPVADWLVRMRRLPAERMLDRLLREDAVAAGELAALAQRLAAFYAQAARAPWSPAAYARRLARDLEGNAAALLLPRYRLPGERIRALRAALLRFLAEHGGLLAERVRAGRIVEGHGDLRPEHICLGSVPLVIDCLEFSRDLRRLDVADELAYLALECERLGNEAAGSRLIDLYSRLSGDFPPAALVAFHQSRRACLRAKLAVWHLDEKAPPDPGKWSARALEYLGLAERHCPAFSLLPEGR